MYVVFAAAHAVPRHGTCYAATQHVIHALIDIGEIWMDVKVIRELIII